MIDDIEFKAEPQGKHSDDDNWEHYLWRVTLTFNGKSFSTDYRMGTGLVDLKPVSLNRHAADQRAKRMGGEVRRNALGPGKDAIAIPRAPTLLDVLGSLSLDCRLGDQLFEDFCDDLGYDRDSRKAEASWRQCQTMHYELRNLFGRSYTEFIETDWEEVNA